MADFLRFLLTFAYIVAVGVAVYWVASRW